jgi:hypothetical protein
MRWRQMTGRTAKDRRAITRRTNRLFRLVSATSESAVRESKFTSSCSARYPILSEAICRSFGSPLLSNTGRWFCNSSSSRRRFCTAHFHSSLRQSLMLPSQRLLGSRRRRFLDLRLRSIHIPRPVQELYFAASSVESLAFKEESELCRIGAQYFCDSFLNSICAPRSVKTLPSCCFRKCRHLRTRPFE